MIRIMLGVWVLSLDLFEQLIIIIVICSIQFEICKGSNSINI